MSGYDLDLPPSVPAPPDRKSIALRYALASDNPAVLDVIERLLIVAEMAHSEEIGNAFDALERKRKDSIALREEWFKRREQRKMREEQVRLVQEALRAKTEADIDRRNNAAEQRMAEQMRTGFWRWLMGRC